MAVIKFKGCPKCRGDLYLAVDIYGEYLNCLQCGYNKDLPLVELTTQPMEPVVALEPERFDLEPMAA